jgi:hypothetical protein
VQQDRLRLLRCRTADACHPHGSQRRRQNRPGQFPRRLEQTRDEIIEIATTHKWTAEELNKVANIFATLKPGALALWASVTDRGDEFIRYNLHRKVLA